MTAAAYVILYRLRTRAVFFFVFFIQSTFSGVSLLCRILHVPLAEMSCENWQSVAVASVIVGHRN